MPWRNAWWTWQVAVGDEGRYSAMSGVFSKSTFELQLCLMTLSPSSTCSVDSSSHFVSSLVFHIPLHTVRSTSDGHAGLLTSQQLRDPV